MNTEQCNGCYYWRAANGEHQSITLHFCHHLLMTGKCRKRDGDTCLSRKEKK